MTHAADCTVLKGHCRLYLAVFDFWVQKIRHLSKFIIVIFILRKRGIISSKIPLQRCSSERRSHELIQHESAGRLTGARRRAAQAAAAQTAGGTGGRQAARRPMGQGRVS